MCSSYLVVLGGKQMTNAFFAPAASCVVLMGWLAADDAKSIKYFESGVMRHPDDQRPFTRRQVSKTIPEWIENVETAENTAAAIDVLLRIAKAARSRNQREGQVPMAEDFAKLFRQYAASPDALLRRRARLRGWS